MAFQEVTSTGWFGRIGESIKGIIFGVVLLIVAPIVLVMNERNAVKDIQANNEIAEKVVSIKADAVDATHNGKLVHLNGPSKTEDILQSEKYGISENAIRIAWSALIYQWVESKETETKKKLGGGEETITTYTYAEEWSNAPVNSSQFKESGHDNTGQQSHHSGSKQAENVTLGAFSLPSPLISKITSSQNYALATLPPGLEGKGQVSSGIFHTGNLGSPQIGDEKVSFNITHPGDVSVMAVQSDDTFTSYKTKSGKNKFLLYEGLLSAEEVVQGEKSKAKTLRWILRGVGVLVMFIGFSLLLKPLSVLADVIPILGSLVGGATGLISLLAALGISFVIVAISWITFRPLLGIPLLIVGVGCLVILTRKMMKGKKTVLLNT